MRTGSHLPAFAARRLLGLAVVVVLTPSVTFVLFGALREERPVSAKVAELPRYLYDTFVRFDFGEIGPATQPEPISHLVLGGLPLDAALLAGGMLVGILLGVSSGLVAGPRRRGPVDRALTVGSSALLSVPVYWLALVALFTIAPVTGWWPIPFASAYGEYSSITQDPIAWVKALWVPWLILGAPIAAMAHRMVRSTLADVQDEEFLRTARAKGLRERVVQRRHALPPALPPVIGLISANMALLVTNVALIEPAFNLPGAFRRAGVGMFLGESAPRIDPLVAQALIVESALLIAVFVLVCDLVQAKLDPRVALRG